MATNIVLGDFSTGEADANILDITHIVASGEALFVAILLESTDPNKEVLSVTWDQGGIDQAALTPFMGFNPTHGLLRTETFTIDAPVAKTATVRIVIEAAASQKIGAVCVSVGNAGVPLLAGLVTSEGDGTSDSVTVNQLDQDLGFVIAGHFGPGAFTPAGGETEHADFDVQSGSFQMWAASEDGIGNVALGWTQGTSDKHATSGFVIKSVGIPVTSDAIVNYASLQGLTVDAGANAEAEQGLIQDEGSNFETLLSVAQNEVSNLEALQGLTKDAGPNIEAEGVITQDEAANLEALQGLTKDAGPNIEAGGGITQDEAVNFETLLGLTKDEVANFESLLGLTKDAGVGSEAGQGLTIDRDPNFEALQGLTVDAGANLEALQGLLQDQIANIESLATALNDAAANFETLLGLIKDADPNVEAQGGIVQALQANFEALLTVTQLATNVQLSTFLITPIILSLVMPLDEQQRQPGDVEQLDLILPLDEQARAPGDVEQLDLILPLTED